MGGRTGGRKERWKARRKERRIQSEIIGKCRVTVGQKKFE